MKKNRTPSISVMRQFGRLINETPSLQLVKKFKNKSHTAHILLMIGGCSSLAFINATWDKIGCFVKHLSKSVKLALDGTSEGSVF